MGWRKTREKETTKILPNMMTMISFVFLMVLQTAYVVGVDPPGYEGCYRRTFPIRHFSISPGNYDHRNLDLDVCVAQCFGWNYQYAAATGGNVTSFCFCAATLPDVSLIEDDANCDQDCSNSAAGQKCGGIMHNSVYKTPLPIEGVSIIVSPGDIITTFNTLSFTAAVRVGTDSMKYEVDVDNSGFEEVLPTFTKSFGIPGEHRVTVKVSDTSGVAEARSGAVEILVVNPVDTATVMCPQAAATYEEIKCNATVPRGSFMTASIQFDASSGVTDSFPMADAMGFSAGPSVPDSAVMITATSTDGVYVTRSNFFKYEGILNAWEFYATTSGPVTFMLLRPDCGGQTYCFEENKCAPSCAGPSQTCAAADVFCAVDAMCTPGTLVGSCPAVNHYATPPTAFKVVATMPYTIPSTGKGFYQLSFADPEIQVMPGDIIGHASAPGNGKIGMRAVQVGEIEDRKHNTLTEATLAGTVGNNYAAGTGEIHALRAIASRPSHALFYYTYTDTGTYTVSLLVSNEHVVASATSTTTVIVQVGINATIIDSPMYGSTGRNTKFSLEPHTGASITYTWDFGDGNIVNTNETYIEHTYLARGEYNVSVVAENMLTRKENSTIIILEDPVENMKVDSPGEAAGATLVHLFGLNMTLGSDYECQWDFGDGNTLKTNSTTTPTAGSSTPYTYGTEGAYKVNVTCWNHVSSGSEVFTQLVQLPIINLRLDKEGAREGEKFNLDYRIDQGTAAACSVAFEGNVITSSYVDATKSATTAQVPAQVTGLYSVVLHCSNKVSDVTVLVNFTVDIEITSLDCKLYEADGTTEIPKGAKEIVQGDTLMFYSNMKTGSSVEIFTDFKDGINHTFFKGHLVGWDPASPEMLSHKFDVPGVLNVTKIIKNKFDLLYCHHLITVYNKVDNLTLISNSPKAYVPAGAIVLFWFAVDPDIYPPTGAHCAFDFGDKTPIVANQPFSMTTKYSHKYDAEGTYLVKVNVSNPLSSKVFEVVVDIIVPVTNLNAHVTPRHAVVGAAVSVGLSMDRGIGVTLYWDFGVTPGWDASKPRDGKTAFDKDEASHHYSAVGEYTITAMGSNALGNTTVTYIIRVQEAVTNDWELTSMAPGTFPTGAMSFTFMLPIGKTPPTDAEYIFDWGDGTGTSTPQTIIAPYSFTHNHIYAVDGDFTITVTASNLASSVTFTYSGAVFESISGLDAVPGYIPILPLLSAPVDGFGDLKDIFPTDRPLALTMSKTSGTVVTYKVEAVKADGTVITLCDCPENPVIVQLTEKGEYDVTVTAINPLSSDSVTVKVNMLERITGLKFEEPGTIKPGEPKTFKVTADTLGQGTCLKIEFGDGTSVAFGEDTDCQRLAKMSSQGPLISPLDIKHTYNREREYQITASAYSDVGDSQQMVTVAVSKAECSRPKIGIENVKELSDPREVLSADLFTVKGTTQLICAETYTNEKQWVITLVDSSSGVDTASIDVTSLETSRNAEIEVPPRFLNYGVYKFSYKVTMSLSYGTFSNTVSTFVKIKASPLLAIMVEGGMSSITRGSDTEVKLDANKYSRDPDVDPNGPQDLTFQYFCKRVDEDNPLEADGSRYVTTKSTPYPRDILLVNNIPDGGGCFRNGPGAAVSVANGVLAFNTLNMQVNETYEVTVEVSKNGRMAETKLLIEIVDGKVPSVSIQCEPCVNQAGYVRINPDVRLVLHGFSTDVIGTARKRRAVTTGGDGKVFDWKIYQIGLNGAWIQLDEASKYMTGQNSKSVALDSKLFRKGYEEYPEYSTYRAKLTVTLPSGETGAAYTIISVNTPPREANCTITPKEGAVLLNKTTVDCQGAYDEDGIASYLFVTNFKDDPLRRVMRYGEENMITGIDFPLGPHYDDFQQSVHVLIVDNLGATTDQFIDVIVVHPMTPAQLEERITKLADDEYIAKLSAESDAKTVAYNFLGIASMLNSYRMANTEEFYNTYVEHPYASTGFGPGTSASHIIEDTSMIGRTEEEKQQKIEENRNLRATLRAQMIDGLTKCTVVSDPAAMLQMAVTIGELTKAPEELTRDAQEQALKMLTDMVETLETMDDVPLETKKNLIDAIATGIGQILEASVVIIDHQLQSDVEDAPNSVFFYYDTDLEALRAGVRNLPTDKWADAFSEDTSMHESRANTAVLVPQGMVALRMMTSILTKGLVAGEDPILISTPKLTMTVHKDVADIVVGNVTTEGRSSVYLPNICSLLGDPNCNQDQIVALVLMSTSFNPYKAARNGEVVPDSSNIIYIELFEENGSKMAITNSADPITITIAKDPNATEVSPILTTQPDIPERVGDDFFYHSFNITADNCALFVTVDIADSNQQFLVMVGKDTFPKLNETLRNGSYFAWGLIPRSMATKDTDPDFSRLAINQTLVDGYKGRVIVGLRQLDKSEHDKYNENNPPPQPEKLTGDITTDYTIEVYSTGCYYFSHTSVGVDPRDDPQISGMEGQWLSDGCMVLDTSTKLDTHCSCTHLTAFGGGLAVQPNKIDWDFVFSNADFMKNPTLYITEIVIFVAFLLAAIWGRRKDKKDMLKLGVTPLPDNSPQDRYLYEVLVYTGMRKNAGTKSNVFFILSGEYDETDVRNFSDKQRDFFCRGQINSFLMAVPRPLGALNYMRVWHDNSGKGKNASWFLKYVVIQDLQTKQKYYFLSNRWFAVEEDDGQVDRLLPVAGPEQMTEFTHLFSQTTKKNLGDGHLWFSVVARPPQSRFTRLQRVACCLCLLYTSMLANALFYEQTPEATGQNAYTLGPFAFNPQQIYVGFITTLMVFPINFIIAWMFRKSRPRHPRKSRIMEALEKSGQLAAMKKEEQRNGNDMAGLLDSPAKSAQDSDTISTISGRPSSVKDGDPPGSDGGYDGSGYGSSHESYGGAANPGYSSAPLQPQHQPYGQIQLSVAAPAKKKKKFSLPWWCIILAWILLFLVVGVCAAFVTFYGIMFQDIKCKKWITSMLVSFFTSIFLTQPIKVFMTAIFLSLIFKNPNIDEDDSDDDEEDIRLGQDEMWLHSVPGDPGYMPRPRKIAYRPPDPEALEQAREIRFKELRMYDVLREIIFYAFFLWILMVISYGFRDRNAYFLKISLDRTVTDQGLGHINTFTDAFSKLRSTGQFWSWMGNTLLPAMRAGYWYNGDPPLGQRGFLSDRTSRIMGYATVRQLRIKPDLCETVDSMKPYTPECIKEYNIFDEDDRAMGIGWKPFVGNSTVNNTADEYTWRSGSDLDGLPYWAVHAMYGGGGYVFELRGSHIRLREKMDRLFQEEWIDRFTRAVFVEFTIYNAQTNLFAIVTMVAEFVGSAGIWPHYRIEPAMLMSYYTSAAVFQVLCEVVYLLFILFFLIKEARKFWKERKQYFLQFWNWVEMSIIVLSIGATVMYFYRLILTKRLTSTFKETHGNKYIKFQQVGYWNELLLYFIGWLVFLATIKFIRLLRFNRRMGLLASTLRVGAKPLAAFGLMFGITFFAFVQFFYLIYFIDLIDFRTIIHSAETCMQMMLGRFNFFEMRGASPVLGPLVFFIYTISVAYILINMFLSILNESFSSVRADIDKQSNEYEMVEFIISRFKTWTGMTLPGAQDQDKSSAYDPFDPQNKSPTGGVHPAFDSKIDNFPEKVDRLMNCISKVYFDQDRFDAIFDSNNESGKMAMKMLMKNQQMKGPAAAALPLGEHPNSVGDPGGPKSMSYC